MKVGDFVRWRDQGNYPGLCGIVTKESRPSLPGNGSPEIFVHWTTFPRDYGVGSGWEKVSDLQLLSTGETE